MAAFALFCDTLLSHKEASQHTGASMVLYSKTEETAAILANANVINAKDDVRSSLFRARERTSDGKKKKWEVKFLICDSCYWCASVISMESSLTAREFRIVNCPVCESKQIEWLTVSTDNNIGDNGEYRRE
jgi:hypothetical protein